MDALAEPCPSWPTKRLYLTADEASVALRVVWAAFWARGQREFVVAYECPCQLPCRHFHLGRRRAGGQS